MTDRMYDIELEKYTQITALPLLFEEALDVESYILVLSLRSLKTISTKLFQQFSSIISQKKILDCLYVCRKRCFMKTVKVIVPIKYQRLILSQLLKMSMFVRSSDVT